MRQSCTAAFVTLILAVGCRTPAAHDASAALEVTAGPTLSVDRSHKLELKELSGLATAPLVDGEAATLYAIGDRTHHLMSMKFADWSAEPEMTRRDLAPLFDGDASQWEGVATDGAGRVFIMREDPSRIFVFATAVGGLVQTIKLDVDDLGENDGNSLGEGLLLMKNGHVLFLKEKDPPLLVEFGPAGESALGVVPEAMLGPDSFALPVGDQTKLVPLKTWEFGASTTGVLKDFSDLAIGADGAIYVLSDESRRIGRLEGRIGVDEAKAKIKAYWDLPASIDKPEGLAFIGDHPVVGSDQMGGKNVFVLSKPQ